MQSEYIYPDLADRSSPKEWEEQGKPVLVNEATAKVAAILAQGDNEVLDAEIDARLRARFDLLLDWRTAGQAVKINLNYIELELMFALS